MPANALSRRALLASTASALAIGSAHAEFHQNGWWRRGKGPSLNLNFLTGTLDPRITFTRASIGTYFDATGTLRTAASGAPRFDNDPAALTPLGLLIEEGRTNSALNSATLSSWSSTGSALTNPALLAPDGSSGVAQLTEDTTTASDHARDFTFTPVASTTYTASCFLKAGTRTQAAVELRAATVWTGGNAFVIVDLAAGTILSTSGGIASSLTRYPNGWYRASITATSVAAPAAAPFRLGLVLGGNTAYNGDGASYAYFWGAQLEVGAFPTSYIPTTGAAVTRATDTASMPLGTWFNAAVGSLEADYVPRQAAATGTQSGIVRVDDTTNNNLAGLFLSNANQIFAFGAAAGVTQMNGNTGAPAYGVPQASAITYGPSWQAISNAGAIITSGTAPPANPTKLTFGSSVAAGNAWMLNGTLRRVRYWSRALSASELQAVTATPPTLDLNFLAGALDPRITFTRASIGTYFDATGTLQTAASGAPRFDNDPAALTPLGLLIEEARTNSIRNPRCEGAAVGTPGTLPTNWSRATSAGITANVFATGTENGISYVDLQLTGTATANQTNIQFETNTGIAASNGQIWSGSFYLKLVSGSLTNISSLSLTFQENTSGGAFVASGNNILSSPTGSALGSQRCSATRTLSGGGTVAALVTYLAVFFAAGAVNCVLRIGAPQLEQGAFATSPVLPQPGSPGATTRAADVATMPVGSWFNSSAGTLCYEGTPINLNTSNTLDLVALNQTSTDAYMIRNQATTASITTNVFSGNVNQGGGLTLGTATVGTPYKAAVTYAGLATTGTLGGAAPSSSSFTVAPASLASLTLAGAVRTVTASHYLRRVRYWPRALSASELQSVTT